MPPAPQRPSSSGLGYRSTCWLVMIILIAGCLYVQKTLRVTEVMPSAVTINAAASTTPKGSLPKKTAAGVPAAGVDSGAGRVTAAPVVASAPSGATFAPPLQPMTPSPETAPPALTAPTTPQIATPAPAVLSAVEIPPVARASTATADEITAFDAQIAHRPPHVQGAWRAVKRGQAEPYNLDVVPVLIIPLFHDAAELKSLLSNLDAPVRTIQLVWNSVNEEMKATLAPLRDFPFGVTIHHRPHNGGFSHAINTGIINGNATLSDPPATWFFAVNADSVYPPGNMPKFARTINEEKLYDSHGLLYGPRLDHFAFAITRLSVQTVGLMDEVFYPGYMEDIDYWWRNGLAELPARITNINFIHKGSVNRRKPTLTSYRQQIVRNGDGFEYGWAKWGSYAPAAFYNNQPPNAKKGWRTPFNIPGAPLSLWKVDPVHRSCIREGSHAGIMMIKSSTCWYNGTGLLSMLPNGTALPNYLVQPTTTLRNALR